MSSLWNYVSIRKDVFNKALDEEVAPSLSRVVFGEANKVYVDPEEFINITYPTDTIKKILGEVIESFISGTGKAIMLPSAYGGGKTHIMILLYHLVRRPDLLYRIFGEQLRTKYKALEGVEVVVIDGTDKRTAPSPLPGEVLEVDGVTIKTLWGYLAYKLNAYDKMKTYDEMLISPEKTTLSQLFSGKKVLILIDELGIYYNRLAKAPQLERVKILERYAEQVVVFLRMLSESVKDNCVVIVMSIPAEPTEKGLEPEPGYEGFVEKVENEFARVAIRAEKPIATSEDFANILKKRLFDKVDQSNAQLISRRLKNLHVDYHDVIKDVSEDVVKFYPFHPLFINTLREVVERNRDLQKTRDALRISRKVVRYLYDRVKDLSLIMPTDIDLRIEEIRAWVLTKSFSGFDLVINKIIDKTREIPVEEGVNPDVYRDLAYRLALYIFLRTYIYDPHLEPRSEFPGKSEVVTGVYDPVRYEQFLISPSMTSELLNRLSSGSIEYRVPHLYSRDGYYWVTRLLDIQELVKKEAEKVDDLTAINQVLNEVKTLFTKPYDARESASPTVFTSEPVILLEPKLIEDDTPKYKVVIIIPPLEDLKEGIYNSGNIYDIIYYRLSGRQKTMRRYANTIVVLFSNNLSEWRDIINVAKMITACERLDKIIKNMYRDEKVVKLLRDELREFKEGLSKQLKYKLVAYYFNLIAFPTIENGVSVVRVERVSPTRKTLVEVIEETLRGVGKVLETKYSRQFDVLVSILEGTPKQEIKWTKEMKVSDVIGAFFENPALQMILGEDIKEALLSGLRELKIGVIREGKIYFKKVEGVETLSKLGDNDLIIPPEVAVEKQIDELSNVEEEVKEDLIIRRYYVAVYEGKEIPIKELRSRYPDNYMKIFIISDIKLREETLRHGFDVSVEPQKLELKIDEGVAQVSIKVFVKRVGMFEHEVVLKSGVGIVEPSKGIPDFEAIWTIPTPKEPGEYTYVLNAESVKLTRSAEVKLVVKKGLLCKSEPSEKVLEIIIKGNTDILPIVEFLKDVNKSVQGLKIIRQCSMGVEFLEEKSGELKKSININLKDVTIDDITMIVRALVSVFGVVAKIKNLDVLKLEVKGDGKVVDLKSLASTNEIIKQKNISVEYCW